MENMENNQPKHEIVVVIPSIREPSQITTVQHCAALLFALRQDSDEWNNTAIVVSDSRKLPDAPGATEDGTRTHNRFFRKSRIYTIPTYHFDYPGQGAFIRAASEDLLPEQQNALRSVFYADYSYGAGRDKAFICAALLNTGKVFGCDDDTYMTLDLFLHHLAILNQPVGNDKKIVAVTGGYCGARAFDVLVFPELQQQRQWEGLVAAYLPDDSPSGADGKGSPIDRLLGGNYLIRREVYERLCCPTMPRTPVTDDMLLGKLAAAMVEEKEGRTVRWEVRKTNFPTMHVHFASRLVPSARKAYLLGWARTVAFWCLFDSKWTEYLVNPVGNLPETFSPRYERAIERVREFGDCLGAVWGQGLTFGADENIRRAILEASHEISDDPGRIVKDVEDGLQQYVDLCKSWRSIINSAQRLGP